MKKRIATIIAMAAMLFTGFTPAIASADTAAETDITGVVTNKGVLVAGAQVIIVCNGHAQSDHTNATGAYLVHFKITDCPKGAVAHATAKSGSLGGNNTGAVVGLTTKLNIGIVNVDLPEFGVVGGIGAGILGIGAIGLVRRRRSNTTTA